MLTVGEFWTLWACMIASEESSEESLQLLKQQGDFFKKHTQILKRRDEQMRYWREHSYNILFLGDLVSGKDDFAYTLYFKKFTEEDIKKRIGDRPSGGDHFFRNTYFRTIEYHNEIYRISLIEIKKMVKYSFIYRIFKGAIILYNIYKTRSYKEITRYIKIIRKNTLRIPIILIGNLCDMMEDYVAPKHDVEELVEKYNLTYLKINTLTGENVDQALKTLLWKLIPSYKK
ncbi:MAG: hypothetical protein ACFFGP_04850 [Promethearchaeota archaeon]